MTRVFNFSAGPAALPEPVLRQAADEMLDWHGSGMSVMEMSHRGKEFIAIHAEAESLLRELLAVPAELQGAVHAGRRHRRERHRADEHAARQDQRPTTSTPASGRRSRSRRRGKYCTVNVAASAKAERLHRASRRATAGSSTRTPPTCTSARNETIGGVEYHWTPDVGSVPLVADMSQQHHVAPGRRVEVRADLRRRAEEHRPGRR